MSGLFPRGKKASFGIFPKLEVGGKGEFEKKKIQKLKKIQIA